MSTKYFILTKSSDNPSDNNENNQIFFLNTSQTFILPRCNIEGHISIGLFENSLIEWSKQFCSKDKNFLDIGAHTGTYSICFAPHVKHVYSFEPQKMTYYALCGSVALSNLQNITCYKIGLGSEEQVGNTQLKIVTNCGGGSSIHHTDTTHNILKEEEIEINTLDNFNFNNIGFIKMDVEENEYFVLKGGIETLKRSDYPSILFEANDYTYSKSGMLFDFLKSIGYNYIPINGYNKMFLATFNR